MRALEILEAIAAWNVDPDLDSNEAQMISKFHGYDREMKHFSTKEKQLIRDPSHIQRVDKAFQRSPVPFSLYFWQTTDPDYDKTSFKGLVSEEWLRRYLGASATSTILSQTSENAITVVLTNNLSDENKVSLSSPWIIAHRIAHAMVGDSSTDESARIFQIFRSFLQKVLTIGYHINWPSGYYADVFIRDYEEIYGKLMGFTLGTMKSARTQKITSVYEWWYETVTQFIMTGKITLKPLPDEFDVYRLTTDPHMRKVVQREWGRLAPRLERAITSLLDAGKGQVFVV